MGLNLVKESREEHLLHEPELARKRRSTKNRITDARQLSSLVQMDSPQAVLDEVQIILDLIFVDDQGRKEYMFRPGSHLQWKATKGFEILIGNAGGIDLEFSGTEIKNLGGHGKVVRLKPP